jgi:hypothetical protein
MRDTINPSTEAGQLQVVLPAAEALHVQHTRDLFFSELRKLLARQVGETPSGLTRS